MPVIRTTLLEGFATAEQRSEITTRLADTLVDIFGDVTKPYIFSIVDEIKPGAWSIAGSVANEEMIAGGRAGEMCAPAQAVGRFSVARRCRPAVGRAANSCGSNFPAMTTVPPEQGYHPYGGSEFTNCHGTRTF